MANTIRIKRRAAGGAAGAPSTLANAELAFNEQDNTLYYGIGTGGSGGSATSVIPIGGMGTFATLASPTFTGIPLSTTAAADTNTTQLATTAYVVGQAGTLTPIMAGVAAIGTSLRYARQDHVHPTDTTRAPLASPVFTGNVTGLGVATGTSFNSITGLSATTPVINGTAAVGVGTTAARGDHVHPTDTTRAPLASPTFTGTVTLPAGSSGPGLLGSTSATVTAAGTTQGTATALTSDLNVVTTSTAGTGLGVVIPGCGVGRSSPCTCRY